MKKRVISGIIITILIILIGIVNNPIMDVLVIITLSMLGIYEYNGAFKKAGYKPISWIGYIGCLAIFAFSEIITSENRLLILKIALPLLIISFFGCVILTKLKRTIVDVAITVFGLLYIPFMFSFLKLILLMDTGRVLILYVFAAAFASDTFAFLVGSKFGKNKLCPEISPKKTIEGSIGGVVGVVIFFLIITIIGNTYFEMSYNIIYMVVAGIVAGMAGQLGDLSASAIKRYCNVKDFGNIIPGHGGILDRLDSLLFVAPIMYTFLILYS